MLVANMDIDSPPPGGERSVKFGEEDTKIDEFVLVVCICAYDMKELSNTKMFKQKLKIYLLSQ